MRAAFGFGVLLPVRNVLGASRRLRVESNAIGGCVVAGEALGSCTIPVAELRLVAHALLRAAHEIGAPLSAPSRAQA